MTRTAALIGVLSLLVAAGLSHAADPGKEILRRALDLSAAVQDYRADVVVVMDLPNLQVPRRTARVFYKRPNKVAIKSRGVVMIPKRVLMPGSMGTEITREAQVQITGKAVENGKLVYALKVIPVEPARRDEHLRVWIRADRYTVERMEVYQGQVKHLAVTWTYQFVNGKHWMPQLISARIYEWRSAEGGKREGTVTATFTNVVVNSGLSDELFKEQKK